VPSDLDRKFDTILAAVTGPGGPIQIGRDPQGRAIVTNLPPTLPGLFDAFCALHANTIAVIADGERLTFAELNMQATRLAKVLVGGWGIRKGDRVGLAMRNAPAWIVSLYGSAEGGRDRYPHKRLVADGRACPCAAAGRAEAGDRGFARGPSGSLRPAFRWRPWSSRSSGRSKRRWRRCSARGPGEAELPAVAPEDDATILFTSGSTGAAKGAVSTHRAVTTGVYAYTLGLATLLGIKESMGDPPKNPPRTLINVPLFHVTGEVPVLLQQLRDRTRHGADAQMGCRRGSPPHRGGDGHLFRRRADDEPGADAASRSRQIQPGLPHRHCAGGAARPVAHVKRLQESFRGAQPALGYGLTETNAAGCGNFWQNYAEKPASTGRPQKPVIELAILGADDEHLPQGERGEVALRGACLFRGYWRDERRPAPPSPPMASSAPATSATRMRTNICSSSIARRTSSSAAVRISARRRWRPRSMPTRSSPKRPCSGWPDERLGEVPAAIVYSEAGSLSSEDLMQFLTDRIAAFKVPVHVRMHDDPLPKLGTGKIDKVSLRERYREELAG
jgi:acyl-CoA synthetase (AMP-forming)/AMP-acid ligase II